MKDENQIINFKNIILTDSRVRFIVFLLLIICVSVSLYSSSLASLIVVVLGREGSSHGIFIPFISTYLLWRKFDEIINLKPQSDVVSGCVMLFAGGLLLVLSKVIISLSLQFSLLSFFFVTAAFILLIFGRKIFIEISFPLFFLTVMIPLPKMIYIYIAECMRLINTWGAVEVTKFIGVPLFQERFEIYLPDVHLQVDMGCSGIRYLLSYFTFSLVYAVLFKRTIYSRLFIILGSIPLAVIGGITRLTAIFLAAHYISPEMAGNRPHIFISWIIFSIFLFGIIAIDQYFSSKQ